MSFFFAVRTHLSVEVKKDAEIHLSALQIAKHIVDAAHQSSCQYKSIRNALKKARRDEALAEEREVKRKKKDEETERKREEKAKERALIKEKKAEEKLAKQKEQEEAEEEDDQQGEGEGEEDGERDGDGRKRKKRRVKGAIDEITDADFPCLANRFSGFEADVADSLEAFSRACLLGRPVVWSNKRSQIKKLLDLSFDFDAKTASNTNTALVSELKQFTSNFAEAVEGDPSKIKSTLLTSEQTQCATVALSLDFQFREALEHILNGNVSKDDFWKYQHTHVLDREDLVNALTSQVDTISSQESALQGEKNTATAEKQQVTAALRQAQQELSLYKCIQMVGFARGKQHDGVLTGLFPHLLYQMEGTRVITTCSILDVSFSVYQYQLSFETLTCTALTDYCVQNALSKAKV